MKRTIGVTIIGWFVLIQGIVQIILSSLVLSVGIAQRTQTLPPYLVVIVEDIQISTGVILQLTGRDEIEQGEAEQGEAEDV
ncbi:MAG: hypothetical protein MI924_02480, partial [Chloroflexales bacterium]|nr:hypothetical protein [Chloroflexales bacterium]